MFQVDDIIVYENGGVCKIAEINTPDFVKNGDVYYKLQPLENTQSTLYVNLKNKQRMRYTISREEATAYLRSIEHVDAQYNEDNKKREREYAEILKSGSYERQLRMLKGIEQERNRRLIQGKKLNSNDDQFLHKLEQLILSEFSIALGDSKQDILEKIEEACK